MTPKLKSEVEEEEQVEDEETEEVEQVEEDEQVEEEQVEDDEETENVEMPDANTDDEEEQETENVEMPEDSKTVEEGESTGGSLLSGRTLGMPNRLLLLAGILAVALYVYFKYLRPSGATTTEETVDDGDGSLTEEVDAAFEEAAQQEQAETASITKDDSDPLAADHQAGAEVFDWG